MANDWADDQAAKIFAAWDGKDGKVLTASFSKALRDTQKSTIEVTAKILDAQEATARQDALDAWSKPVVGPNRGEAAVVSDFESNAATAQKAAEKLRADAVKTDPVLPDAVAAPATDAAKVGTDK